ncbi:MAG: DEAD/DEAH box helicase [Aggregatilineales bacterium]
MMSTIIHGTMLPARERFVVWAESLIQTEKAQIKRGRQVRIPPHPFAISHDWLAGWLANYAPHLRPSPITTTIWLPSTLKTPQPSPELQAAGYTPSSPSEDSNVLKAWTVTGLELLLTEAVDFLLTLPSLPGITAGSDATFWRTAALYALELAAAQRALPTLERQDGKLIAHWQADHTAQFGELAAHMPPLCRAAVESPEAALPAGRLLDRFVQIVVDGLARQAASRLTPRVPATPGGKWLSALTGEQREVALHGIQADRLLADWQTWAGQAQVAGNAAFKITFRLDAPDDAQKPWQLQYLVQATDDPSLMVRADQIWRGETAAYLQARFDQPQERLLTGLGFAARLFPPIEASLRSVAPRQAILNSDQAYTFLREVAPLLQGSGFGVLLPRWWGAKGASALSAKAKIKTTKTTGKSLLTLTSLIHYEWQVMLGGQPISRAEFEALAALKQPLVMVRGQWVALDAEQVDAAIRFFERSGDQATVADALQLALDATNAQTGGLPVTSVELSGWLKALLDSLQQPNKIELYPPPSALQGQLRPYQVRGFSWLAFMRRFGLGTCLADDMGLGKTITAIALLLHVRDELKTKTPALIVCPTSVVGNWRRELNRFAPDVTVMVHHGPERAAGKTFAKQGKKCQVVITSYPLLARDQETLTAVEWSTVILDEAQNIKNSATKQAQAARALHTTSRIALTGTPVENRLSELWSILNFLNPDYLGSEAHFRRDFAGPIERGGDAEAARRLKQLTGPFILRRVKTDKTIIADLPEKLEMKVYCTLTTEQGTLYEAVVKDALERIQQAEADGDPMARRGLVLSMLLRLKLLCNHPAQFLKDGSALDGRSGKLARLKEMLEEVYAEGDRALVFTQFAEMGSLLQVYLRDAFYDEPLWLHGATKTKDREAMIQRFQASHGPTVFLLSIKAGGVGLNLTRANHVFHFDRWWNPAVENQATDRAFRIGQTRNVQVHKFICAGTLEEKIDEMIESKKKLAENIIGADESWLTELSTGDLRELVTLRASEVG